MKEFAAETGGRYTYVDDIVNLQELALSMTSLFASCSNFIISGCDVSDTSISSGYVWINGKIRYFAGKTGVSFPYYVHENNNTESVAYANDVNKKGRTNYLTAGSQSIPSVIDQVTGLMPQYIEITPAYAPRLSDKFFGKYAMLLDNPAGQSQTVRGSVVYTGGSSANGAVKSKTEVSVLHSETGRELKNVFNSSGDASVGLYLNGLLVNEIVLGTDGTISFLKSGKQLLKLSESGVVLEKLVLSTLSTGSLQLSNASIANITDATDAGAVKVNEYGLDGGNTKFRDFCVYDGKQGAVPILHISGSGKSAIVNGTIAVKGDNGIVIQNNTKLKSDNMLTGTVSWKDSQGELIAVSGFDTVNSFDYRIENKIGNVEIKSKSDINLIGVVKVNGAPISETYVSTTAFNQEIAKKVSAIEGMGLSSNDYTSGDKEKLGSITTGSIPLSKEGYALTSEVISALSKKLDASKNLTDLTDKSSARANLSVYSKNEINGSFLNKNNSLSEFVTLSSSEIEGLSAEEIVALKLQKQAAARMNINAEEKGAASKKLDKDANLSDLNDKGLSRNSLGVYSKEEVNNLLANKLDSTQKYSGVVFTQDMLNVVNGIKYGNFEYTDELGVSHVLVDGIVKAKQVKTELDKKAPLLLNGYSAEQISQILSNLKVRSQSDSDNRYSAKTGGLTQFVNSITSQSGGTVTTDQAKDQLCEEIGAAKSKSLSNYLTKTGLLSELEIAKEEDKAAVCQKIGAAYAPSYQTKIPDSSWKKIIGTGKMTNNQLYTRQIGNIVCIQGTINTDNFETISGVDVLCELDNAISPPAHAVGWAKNEIGDAQYNRGIYLTIDALSRKIVLKERYGAKNWSLSVSITYMV